MEDVNEDIQELGLQIQAGLDKIRMPERHSRDFIQSPKAGILYS